MKFIDQGVEVEFVRLDPPPTGCISYGTGGCCHDRHFDVSEVTPQHAGQTACGIICSMAGNRSVTDKKYVNCKECLELIHS